MDLRPVLRARRKSLPELWQAVSDQNPISRVVVDLERYANDSEEPNSAFGMGAIYTHNTLGERIRRELAPQERRLPGAGTVPPR